MAATKKAPKTIDLSPAGIRKLAAKAYSKELRSYGEDAPNALLPALAKREIAASTGLPLSRLASLVDPVYYRENGLRNPLPLPATRNERTLATAIRKRRDAGGTLGRWETLAASTAAALGRPVSEAAVRALYSKGGGDLDASYVGKGTRVAAPKTRESETAEVAATL